MPGIEPGLTKRKTDALPSIVSPALDPAIVIWLKGISGTEIHDLFITTSKKHFSIPREKSKPKYLDSGTSA